MAMRLFTALPDGTFSTASLTSRHLGPVSLAMPVRDMGRGESALKPEFSRRSLTTSSMGMTTKKFSTMRWPSTTTLGTRTTMMKMNAICDDDNMNSLSVISAPVFKGSRGVCRVSLRNATLDDLEMLLAWDEKEHLQDSGGDVDFNDWNWEYELPRNLSWRYQLVGCLHKMVTKAEDDNNASVEQQISIGFVQIMDPKEEETHYWGEPCESSLRAIDIWIGEEDYIGQGYGTHLMKLALKICFEGESDIASTVNAVLIDPMYDNKAAHRFYQRLGFIPIGERYFGPDRCLVHRLNRTDYFAALTENK